MDALTRAERGQSLVVAALLAAVAALALTLVHGTGDRLVSAVRDQRAGEAAVAAAGSAVADLQLARVRSAGRALTLAEIEAFAAEDAVLEAAREAARRMAEAHGGAGPVEVTIKSFGSEIEVHLTLGGRRHIALLSPPA
ncbi:MAG: hypothetical protein ACRDGT_08615 [Candidatus Limnocylindria bacterium]